MSRRRSALTAFPLLVALCLAGQASLAAQEAPAPAESVDIDANPFARGDSLITLSGGVHVPLFISPEPAAANPEATLKVGGAFAFSWQGFVGRGLTVGGAIAADFNSTIGGRGLFTLPLSARLGYWTVVMPFEIFGSLDLGAYLGRFDGYGTFGPYAKLGGGAAWRTPSGWSIGLEAYWCLLPEIHTGAYADLTRYANFLQTGIVAVYHL